MKKNFKVLLSILCDVVVYSFGHNLMTKPNQKFAAGADPTESLAWAFLLESLN